MRLRHLLPALLACLLMTAATFGEPLKKGDRVVFLGDSITQAGAGPGGYVTLVREALAKDHKDLEVEVIGAGISGHKVPDLEARLDKDVIAKKPTIVVIYIGINDVWHSQSGKGTPKEAFEKGLKSIIARIEKAGGRSILCTASVIGEKTDGTNPLDKMLDEYCEISRGVAKETKSQLIDLRQAFLAHLKKNNADNKAQGILTSDTVHLNAAGNKFVAEQMLAGLLGAAKDGEKKASDEKASAAGQQIRHVVLFKFKAGTTPEQLKTVTDAFAALAKSIDVIQDFEWGTNVSPEGLNQGFTHCFFVTFASAKDRDTYLVHAEHKKFVEILKPHMDGALVVDYATPKK